MNGPSCRVARRVVLISTNFGLNSGGEAIKAYQYAKHLESSGYDFLIVTHGRSRHEIEDAFESGRYLVIEDDPVQRLIWRSVVLRPVLDFYFHWRVRRALLCAGASPGRDILHYIGPVSPVSVRLSPPGFEVVMGPLTGNIYHPPAFRGRMALKDRLRERLHVAAQWLLGRVFADKRRASAVLVSGYERTRASLRIAGCRDEQMLDVVDAGVSDRLRALPRVVHEGANPNFLCSGRLVDHKGIDLAIRALARSAPENRLDVYGDGVCRPALERLARGLGLAGRVRFHGWVAYADLLAAFPRYRAYVFPSLAEANGIVMQEAMMVGLPVVALRWGGPGMLADDESAIYVAPESEQKVIADIARAMDRLAGDADFAETISRNARRIAEAAFTWEAASESWERAYGRCRDSRGLSGRSERPDISAPAPGSPDRSV